MTVTAKEAFYRTTPEVRTLLTLGGWNSSAVEFVLVGVVVGLLLPVFLVAWFWEDYR